MATLPEDVKEFIANMMLEGFDSVHEMIACANEFASEFHDRDFSNEINATVAELLAEQLGRQAEWKSPTDCERLDAAFAALNRQGIVARQNFSCCNNCGFTEIWDEVEEAEKSQIVTGYVFYHLQCTARAIKTGQLLMAYGSIDDNLNSLNRVVSTIVTELRNSGLPASWAGTLGHPIVIDGIAWQRRR